MSLGLAGRGAAFALLSLLAGAAGCAQSPTELFVSVSADATVPSHLTSMHVTVTGTSGQTSRDFQSLSAPADDAAVPDFSLPTVLVLQLTRDGVSGPVEIRVDASDPTMTGDTVLATGSVAATLPAHQTTQASVVLTAVAPGTGGAGGGGGRGSGGRGSGGSSASGGTTSGSGGLGSGGTDACTPGKTWTGDANLHSMADLESLRGYTAVTGFLYIGSSAEVPAPDISTLDALSCLATVGNDLELLEDPYLTDLRGLENLKSVGHDFKMSSMASLGTLDALRGVTVARVFLAKDDPALVSLGRGVTSASSLEISSDASLPHCELLAFEASVSGVVTCTCDATAPGTCTSPGADAGVDAGVDAAAP